MNEVKLRFTDTEAFHMFIYAGDLKLLYFLFVLMIVDVVTGFAKAIKNNNLWSKKSMKGFAKKLLIFCIIILANIIDQILQLKGGLLMITIFYYIANEGLSIVENCAEMDVLVPEQIKDKLRVIKNDSEKSDNNERPREDR
ncbi:TPA: phage holin family protein [Staphylococcus aureus]|uniref:Holin n=1 Tax=Staphylococcus phage GRCS TaxID=1453367 RepID=W6E8H8_9CAUD|nr:holin [Staphylococcus phage GRCS]QQM14814.1 putative holin [Staphylococcus phage TSP]HDP4613310.1 phage holin family protein [Staphylococcus aureus]AHJ10587.1 holin [Staphylococcus phage GRCS]HDP4618842.1 phage holin family protein [Staphylococcus aureus]HDP4631780.1 phage holin family protein [Staphylococcus aureus]